METTRNISLPDDLCCAAEQRFAHRFGSVDELLAAVLDHLLSNDALAMDAKEEHIIEERLKRLGYI